MTPAFINVYYILFFLGYTHLYTIIPYYTILYHIIPHYTTILKYLEFLCLVNHVISSPSPFVERCWKMLKGLIWFDLQLRTVRGWFNLIHADSLVLSCSILFYYIQKYQTITTYYNNIQQPSTTTWIDTFRIFFGLFRDPLGCFGLEWARLC